MKQYDSTDLEDIRSQEISSLQCIYPDLQVNQTQGTLIIPIELPHAISISYENKAKTEINYLPSVTFKFYLSDKYPYEEAPGISLECSILSNESVTNLLQELYQLWESYKDQILFYMIDHLKQYFEGLGHSEIIRLIALNPSLYQKLIENDRASKLLAFNRHTYTCQICQEDRKGDKCVQIDSCNHVFCINCIGDYFKNSITTGEVENIHCPDIHCTKSNAKKLTFLENLSIHQEKMTFDKFYAMATEYPLPLELLHKILENYTGHVDATSLLNRYIKFFKIGRYSIINNKYSNRFTKCPKQNCGYPNLRETLMSNLVICQDCKFAYCYYCQKSWHGTINPCKFSASTGKYGGIDIEDLQKYLYAEIDSFERESLQQIYGRSINIFANEYKMDLLFEETISSEGYMKCPNCSTVIEKTTGCNRVICSNCPTAFCYLCGTSMKAYEHFNFLNSPCYGKLFEGMPGTDVEDHHNLRLN